MLDENDAAFSFGAEKRATEALIARNGMEYILFLLCPFGEKPTMLLRKTICGWFWVPFDTKRYNKKKYV